MRAFSFKRERDKTLAISIVNPELTDDFAAPKKGKLRSVIDYLSYAVLALIFAQIWQALLVDNTGLRKTSSLAAIVLQLIILCLAGLFFAFPWWGKLLLAGGSLGSFLLISQFAELFSGPFAELMANFGEQLRYSLAWLFWSAKLAENPPPYEPLLLSYLLLTVLSVLAILLFWRFPSPQLLLLAFISGFFFQNKSANSFDHNMGLLFAGLFLLAILYARQYSHRLNWRKFLQLPAIIPAAVLIALLFFLYNALPQFFLQNQKLYDNLAFIRERFKREEKLPDTINYYEFSLRDLGYYPAGDRLGGPLKLEEKPFMRFEGPSHSVYLRGTLFKDYDLNRWIPVAMDPNYIFNSEDPRPEQRQAFGLDESLIPQSKLDSLSDLDSASIWPIEQPVQVVFNPGRLVSLTSIKKGEEGESTIRFFFNQDGQIYASHVLPASGYKLSARFPRPLGYSELELKYKELITTEEKAEIPAKYRLLMEEFDPALAALVYGSSEQGINSRLGRLFLARDYLSRNYKYNLAADMPGANEDFFVHFLGAKEGYCTYFATAMALIARDLGFESRYVEGFLVPGVSTVGLGRYERQVLTTDAHAWSEVYLPQIGWVIFDATPQSALEQMQRDPEHEIIPPPSESEAPPPENTTVPPPPTEKPEPSQEQPEPEPDLAEPESEFKLPAIVYYFLGLIILCALVAFWLYKRQLNARRRSDLAYLLKHYDLEEIMNRVWQDMKRIYAIDRGQELPAQLTILTSYTEFNRVFRGVAPEYIGRAFAALEKNYYAGKAVTEAEVEILLLYYAELEAVLRQRQGSIKYFWKRIVRGPKA
ncbi:MAG: transglutaminase-like domain-containing protein [Eubacteriales bacterium]|nr:transglutaminase-like domain-containing protein [Eubacteriales bacterium]